MCPNPPANVFVRSAASTLAGFSVAGPCARDIVQSLVRDDLSASAFKLFHVRETAVGYSPAVLTRAGFTGELGYEIWTTPDYFASLYDDLLEAGRAHGLVHFGGRALSSLRLEKGYGSFNKDFRPDYTPAETGLDRFVDFGKEDFVGRAAVLAERATGPKRRFVVMEVETRDADVVGYESIMQDGRAVGYVTSGAYGHCVGKIRGGLCPGGPCARRRALGDRCAGGVLHGDRPSGAVARSTGSTIARLKTASPIARTAVDADDLPTPLR